MLKGSIYIVSDENILLNMIQNHRVITIGDVDKQFAMQINAIEGDLLLPPYPAIMAECNGDMNSFIHLYTMHLSDLDVLGFVKEIIRGLYLGCNYVFYLPKAQAGMAYSKVLLEYFRMNFGITVGSPTNNFIYDITYNGVICSLLYSYNYISIDEFFFHYPPVIPIDDNSIIKLIREVNPYVPNTDFDTYRQYFYNYKEKIKRGEKITFSPFKRSRSTC